MAKIHGAAVGAGLDMALMCDVRIAGESASMSESYFNAGIVPGDGGAYFLPRLVGRDKALDLFWTARTLKGKEAADLGLVTHCVPDEELDTFVENYMKKILEHRSRQCASQSAPYCRVSRVHSALPGPHLLFHGNRHRTRRLPSEDQRPRCKNAAKSTVKTPSTILILYRKPITQKKAVHCGQLFSIIRGI